MQLSLSFKVLRQHPLNNSLQLGSQLVTYSKLCSYVPLYSTYSSLCNSWPELAIKDFGCMQLPIYNQISAASDWLCLFVPWMLLLSLSLHICTQYNLIYIVSITYIITWFCLITIRYYAQNFNFSLLLQYQYKAYNNSHAYHLGSLLD